MLSLCNIISQDQEKTVDFKGAETTLVSKGRHDPCVVPRAIAIVEVD
jgi:chorismate synthase